MDAKERNRREAAESKQGISWEEIASPNSEGREEVKVADVMNSSLRRVACKK